MPQRGGRLRRREELAHLVGADATPLAGAIADVGAAVSAGALTGDKAVALLAGAAQEF